MTPDQTPHVAAPPAESKPLWRRWVLAAVVAVAVVVAVVLAVHRAGPEAAPNSEAAAEAETNRIADVAISEDEAPRSAALSQSVPVAVALERAIGSDVRSRIESGQLTGPFQHITCQVSGASRSGRTPYSCTVRSAGVTYPFLAVADQSTRRLVWCKVDESATPHTGPEIPISERCRV